MSLNAVFKRILSIIYGSYVNRSGDAWKCYLDQIFLMF